MYPILLLSVLLGQCGPGGCPSPSRGGFNGGYSFQPSFQTAYQPVIQPNYIPEPPRAAPLPERVLEPHWIKYDGVRFTVFGVVKNRKTGLVTWDIDDPMNRASYLAALKARDELPTAKATPVVLPVPKDVPPSPTLPPAVRPADFPITPAKAARPVGDLPANYGMEPSKMKRVPAYTAPSAEAKRFIEEAKEDPTDSTGAARLHVTVIGSEDERMRVVNDLNRHPAFAGMKGALAIQDYDPKEWPIDPQLGFTVSGKPTIFVQLSKGKNDPKGGRVVYKALDYSMGPDRLAEAIRKADPSYKPNAGPDASVSPIPGVSDEQMPWVVVAVIGILLVLLLPRKDG